MKTAQSLVTSPAAPTAASIQLVRPKQAAELMGISMATFWRLIRAQKLHAVRLSEKITAVRLCEIEALIASKTEA